jgi:hypothetical protein
MKKVQVGRQRQLESSHLPREHKNETLQIDDRAENSSGMDTHW